MRRLFFWFPPPVPLRWKHPRFRVPIDIALLVLAAVALDALALRLRSARATEVPNEGRDDLNGGLEAGAG